MTKDEKKRKVLDYIYIIDYVQKNLLDGDGKKALSNEFKAKFANFFDLQIPQVAYEPYFDLLVEAADAFKKKGIQSNEHFAIRFIENNLEKFQEIEKQGMEESNEAAKAHPEYSAFTKLLHVLDPNLPIYDSIVGETLGLNEPKNVQDFGSIYKELCDIYGEFLYYCVCPQISFDTEEVEDFQKHIEKLFEPEEKEKLQVITPLKWVDFYINQSIGAFD